MEQAVRKHWRGKACLHPNAGPGTCGRIIDAHTVQRSGALREIVDSKNPALSGFFDRFGDTFLRSTARHILLAVILPSSKFSQGP